MARRFGVRRALLNRGPYTPLETLQRISGDTVSWPLQELAGATTAKAYDADGLNSALDGTHFDVVAGAAGDGVVRRMAQYVAADDPYTDIYSAALNSLFDSDAGTLGIVAQSDTWGATVGGAIKLGADADNIVQIYRGTANLVLQYRAGGTSENIVIDTSALPGGSPSGLFMVILTWDTTADEVKAYYNDGKQGSTLTIAGTWAGNLDSASCVIGAGSTAPASEWDGKLAYGFLFGRAITIGEVTRIYNSLRIG